MYHSRYILHYHLTLRLYRMWYLIYHLCEVVCLMHNHLLSMYQVYYITYHKVVCHRTKLHILKKQYSINCKTCTTCNTSFSILDCLFWNISYKCCKLVFVYHCRYILHYLLTHSLYRMWYLVYHLFEIVCLMHNHL